MARGCRPEPLGLCGTATIADIDASRQHPHRRVEPAHRGAGAERAHPQGVAARRECRAGRRKGRSDLRLLASGQRPQSPDGGARPEVRRRFSRSRRWSSSAWRALCGDDGAGGSGAAMQLAERTSSKLLILHTAAGRVGALDVGCTTEGGIDAALKGADVIYNLGADEGDITPGRLRDLPGQPRRSRRAPGRRDPAGRRLDRGAGALRQHRGAAAACAERQLPAGRGQGELGDPARVVGRAGQAAGLRYAGAAAAGAGRGGAASARGSTRCPTTRSAAARGAISPTATSGARSRTTTSSTRSRGPPR